MQDVKDVQNCTTCDASLERGATYLYQGETVVEKICFECNKDLNLKEYRKDKRLRTRLLMDASSHVFYHTALKEVMNTSAYDAVGALEKAEKIVGDMKDAAPGTLTYAEIYLATLRIEIKLDQFENKVWFGGLQPIIRRSKKKGVSARPKRKDEFMVLTYSICGRTMFTIQDKESSVTLITEEDGDERRMGLQGIDASEENALRLLDMAISLWQDGKLKFEDDNKVGII